MAGTIDNLINYQGNPNLGIGSNADIPVANKEDFSTVNNALRDVMMLNNEKNVRLYQQKIADRDNLNELIAKNQVSTGTINPEDQKYVNEGQKRMQDAFLKWGGNFNDTNGYRAYQQAAQQYKDTITQAQGRYLGLANLRKEASTFTLDRDKNDIGKFIDGQQKQNFWNPITPYQKLHDYSADNLQSTVLGANSGLVSDTGIGTPQLQPTATAGKTTTKMVNGRPVTTTTQITTPIKGQALPKSVTAGTSMSVNAQGQLSPFGTPTTRYYSWDNMKKNAQNAFIDGGEGYQNIQQHFQAFQDYLNNPAIDDVTKKNAIDSMNRRITEEYVQQTGGNFGKPAAIQVVQDANGQKHINMSAPDFAAATTLAGINGNYKVTEPGAFNKDIAKYDVDLENAKTNSIYKGIMGAAAMKRANAYAAKVGAQLKQMKSQDERDTFTNGLFYKNILEQPDLIKTEDSGTTFMRALPADKSLPLYTFKDGKPSQIIPFGATPIGKDGNPVDINDKGYDPKINPIVGYRGGYYKPEYLVDGKPANLEGLRQQYETFVQNNSDAYKKTGDEVFHWKGNMNEWLKTKIKKQQDGQPGGISLKIYGDHNTVTDADLNKSALQYISNANQKKFQTGAFDEGEMPDQTAADENTNQE